MKVTAAILGLGVFLLAAGQCEAQAQGDCKGIGGIGRNFVQKRIVVRPLDPQKFLQDFEAKKLPQYAAGDVLKVEQIGTTGAFVVDSQIFSTEELLSKVPKSWNLVYAERDPVFTGHGAEPNDPDYIDPLNLMWGLRAIHAPGAWRFGTGKKDVVAAIVDSGIEHTHVDLEQNLWRANNPMRVSIGQGFIDCLAGDIGYDAIGDDCQPERRSSHGTRTSGVVGARGNNGLGIVGVNWEVSLLSVTFLDAAEAGCASRAVKALEFVRRAKESGQADIRVVNLSWGGTFESAEIENQLQELAKAGVVIVASAGNSGASNDCRPTFPASHASVRTLISVAATQGDGEFACVSNHGRKSVHIAAPGIEVRTTDRGDIYREPPGGTSWAAAFVSGAVALLAAQCPGLSAMELKNLILNNADEVEALKPFVIGGRFLNVQRAAEACAAMPASARTKR